MAVPGGRRRRRLMIIARRRRRCQPTDAPPDVAIADTVHGAAPAAPELTPPAERTGGWGVADFTQGAGRGEAAPKIPLTTVTAHSL